MSRLSAKVIHGLLVAVISFSISLSDAKAESAGGVVISPPFQQVSVGDGKNTEFSITVTNRTNAEQKITATTVDFKSLDESGGVAFLGSEINELERKYGLAKWLKLDSSPTVIAPNTSRKVSVTLENRTDLTPGGHYGAIIFKVESGKPADDSLNTVDVRQVLASLVFAKKLGGERYDLKLVTIATPEKWAGGDQKIHLRFYNPGNVHVVPRGTVKLMDSQGVVLAKNVINQESGILLPETYRVYPVSLNDVPVLKPGKYKIVAEYRYDGIEQSVTLTKEISIFDWRFAATLAAIASVSIASIVLAFKFWSYRRRKKRQKKKPKYHAAF